MADMTIAIEKKIPEAKKAAVQNGKNYFLYQESNGEVSFLPEDIARKAGITALEIVSYLQ